MKNIILCLAVSLCNTGAFAGSFNELQSAAGGPGVMEERIPVFETPKASLADKQYDYNFRCIAGPSTPQYIAPTCYLYTARGQQACQSAGCNWAIGGTPLPSFHCAAASFTPQYVAPTCYLYTGRGQQACVNAGCSWTFGAKAVNRGCNQSGTVDPYCGAGNWRCYAEVNGTNIYGGCASSMSDCWSGGSSAVNCADVGNGDAGCSVNSQSGTVDVYCGPGNWRCYADATINGSSVHINGGCTSNMSDCWSGGSGAVNPCR